MPTRNTEVFLTFVPSLKPMLMFSGIVEECATLVAMVKDQENVHFTFKCSFVDELKIDQSVSHNGVCLTVVNLTDDTYTVTAMKETLDRSNLGLLQVGDEVNVERGQGFRHRQRRQPDRLQPDGRYVSSGHHPLYLRAHQFPRHPGGERGEYRVRHHREVYQPDDTVSVDDDLI